MGDLRWEPRLGAFVDFVEFEDGVTDGGAALRLKLSAEELSSFQPA